METWGVACSEVKTMPEKCLTFAKIKNKAIPPNETNRSSPAQSMSQADDDSPRVLPGGKGVVA